MRTKSNTVTKKLPRSSRICLNCNHKYSSHIDVMCLKIVQRHPRIECNCKGFIANERELEAFKNKAVEQKEDSTD